MTTGDQFAGTCVADREAALLRELDNRVRGSVRLQLMEMGYRGEELEAMRKALRGDRTLKQLKLKQLKRRRRGGLAVDNAAVALLIKLYPMANDAEIRLLLTDR